MATEHDRQVGEAGGRAAAAAERIAAALDALAARFEGCAAAGADGGRWAEMAEELRFACAALRHRDGGEQLDDDAVNRGSRRTAANRLTHLAVIGPTQVGKSTIVNALLGAAAAVVSPLAGFTVHPQGFWVGACEPSADELDGLFRRRRKVAAWELSREELDTFAISAAPRGSKNGSETAHAPAPVPGLADSSPDVATSSPHPGLPPEAGVCLVVWDTPDFDSTRSSAYRAGVFDTVAFADAIIFVLSLEKHGDREGWEIFRTIHRLDRPCVICLNKLTDAARAEVLGHVERLLAEHGVRETPPIVTLPLATATNEGAALPAKAIEQLRACAREAIERGRARDRRPGVAALLSEGWQRWWAPVRAEHAAARAWRSLVDAALADAVTNYRRDFLDHPQRYDSFNAVVVELLRLIELPVIGDALHRARQVVTWPLRQALTYGRKFFSQGAVSRVPEEERVLRDLVDGLLTRLERDAGRRTDAAVPAAGFWHAMYGRLAVERGLLQAEFEQALRRYAETLREEVRRAAADLHGRLKENPVVLNSLRTALTAGDVLSVVVAVKSFGLAPSDALLIPALVAVTSTLTQGALAAYIGAVRDRLKQKQLENVRVQLDSALAGPLRSLSQSVAGERVIGVGEHVAADADAALQAWTREIGRGAHA